MGGRPSADFVAALTLISPALVIVACPQMTSTLFFLSRKPTPFDNWVETPRERATTLPISKLGLAGARP